ncbi:MAG: DDE-type integrase/transposase/recombinase, partial [Cytophagales bacterium]|nr:DDE-type integrase/transposase/recombinase [Cytophagales bacterium]
IIPHFLENGINMESEDIADEKNAIALRMIRSSVSEEVIPFIENVEDARETWNILRANYDVVDEESKFSKIIKLFSQRKDMNDSMSRYVSKKKQIFTQINTIKREDKKDVFDEILLKAAIIMGLPKQIRDQTVTMNVPKMTVLELQNTLEKIVITNPIINSVSRKSHPGQKNRKNSQKTCFICKQTSNHSWEKCPEAICKKCKQSGHIARNCRLDQTNAIHDYYNKTYWLIDQGSSNHFIDDPKLLSDVVETQGEAEVANGNTVIYAAKGTATLMVDSKEIILENVYYSPQINKNIISVGSACRQNFTFITTDKFCRCLRDDEKMFEIKVSNSNLYFLECTIRKSFDTITDHERFGHSSNNVLKQSGLKPDKPDFCETCTKAEHPTKPCKRKRSHPKSYEILERIHLDLCGPLPEPTIHGEYYFMTITDEASRKTRTYLLKKKSDAYDAIKQYKALSEKETKKQIQIVKNDGASELKTKDLEKFLADNGIKHIITNPDIHAENGIAERKQRTILKKARAMMFNFNLNPGFWGYAVKYATYLHNKLLECLLMFFIMDKYTSQQKYLDAKPW